MRFASLNIPIGSGPPLRQTRPLRHITHAGPIPPVTPSILAPDYSRLESGNRYSFFRFERVGFNLSVIGGFSRQIFGAEELDDMAQAKVKVLDAMNLPAKSTVSLGTRDHRKVTIYLKVQLAHGLAWGRSFHISTKE